MGCGILWTSGSTGKSRATHSHELSHRNYWQQPGLKWHSAHVLHSGQSTLHRSSEGSSFPLPEMCAYFTSKWFCAQGSNPLCQPTQINFDSVSTFWFHTLLSCTDTIKTVVWQAKLSLVLRWTFELTAFQQSEKLTAPNTWLWKFEQGGIHFVTITFLPNNKVSHVEVLAVNKEWASSCGQRQFFYSCNMVMQNLKNRR